MRSKIFETINFSKLRSKKRYENDIKYEKQIEALKKLKDEEKNNYENQIKNIKKELIAYKMKNAKQQLLINATNDKIKNLTNINGKGIKDNMNHQNYYYIILIISLICYILFKNSK